MNSVISAFKTKKSGLNNDKHTGHNNPHAILGFSVGGNNIFNAAEVANKTNTCSICSPGIVVVENRYQHLRHYREIDTTTTMLSPLAVADNFVEEDTINFLTPCLSDEEHSTNDADFTDTYNIIKAANMKNIVRDNGNSSVDFDIIDNSYKNIKTFVQGSKNCERICQAKPEGDDFGSQTPCTNPTSSSSELSVRVNKIPSLSQYHNHQHQDINSTPSRVKSLSDCSTSPLSNFSSPSSRNSSSNSSNGGDVTMIVASSVSTTPPSTLDINATYSQPNSCSNLTLPIIMPNSTSGLGTFSNSTSKTPKHVRYLKPRLSLSRFINHSMPSVHGHANNKDLSCRSVNTNVMNTDPNPPKRLSTHQRNLSLDFR